ncbi:MAG: hypothetical protein RBS43_06360 [Candidatus Cloacimonas sp.]|jgi:hypothetical protein|nr:hypothetical protein [Candidatus Cloacimonas sp.]
MKKAIKQAAIAGGVLFVGYQGFRMFRLIKSVIALDKALPDYLESVYSEKPKVSCMVNAHITINTKITVKYRAEILANHDDIEATTRQYIADFYPLLANSKLTINVVEESL